MDQQNRIGHPDFGGNFIPMMNENYNQPVFPMNFNQNLMQYSPYNQPSLASQQPVMNYSQFGGPGIDNYGRRNEQPTAFGNQFNQTFQDNIVAPNFNSYLSRPSGVNNRLAIAGDNMPGVSNNIIGSKPMDNVTITQDFPQDFQYLLKNDLNESAGEKNESEIPEINKVSHSEGMELGTVKNNVHQAEHDIEEKKKVEEATDKSSDQEVKKTEQINSSTSEIVSKDKSITEESNEVPITNIKQEIPDEADKEDSEIETEDDMDDESVQVSEDELNSTDTDSEAETKKTKKKIQKKSKKKATEEKKDKFVVKIKSKGSALTEKKEHKCPTCGKIVNSLRAYEKHLNLHTDKYACDICKKRFNCQGSLNTHQKTHEGFVGTDQCKVCDKIFYDKSSLNKHTLSVHMGITNFTCQYCDKSFFAKKTYEEHVRVHTGERPFKCTICPKSYKRISDLNHHIRLHKGETKHTCEVCGEGFRRISELNRHKQKHQTSDDSYTKSQIHACEWCRMNFSTAKALKQHVTTHFESVCTDDSLLSRPYQPNQGLVDGIIQNLSTKFIHRNEAEMSSRNQIEFPRFGPGPSLGVTDMSRQYSSISQSGFGNTRNMNNPGRLTDYQTKLPDTSAAASHNEVQDLTVRTQPMENGQNENKKTSPGNVKSKFEIKVENVEEDGVDHMYINKTIVNYDNQDDGDDDVPDPEIHEQDDYNADTDVEDYSYIIKDDDEIYVQDVDSKPKKGRKSTKGKGKAAATAKTNTTGTRKRQRKGKPARKISKPKKVKITKDEVLSEDDFLDDLNDFSESKDEKKDADFEPPSSKRKKKGDAKKGKKGKAKNNEEETPDLDLDEMGEDIDSKPNKKKKKKNAGSEKKEKETAPLVCEECGKIFSSASCFKKHMNLHTGLFSCGTCGKSCSSRNALETHEGLHTGHRPKPAKCNVCDKEFYDSSSMNKHVKNVHMNYKPFPCPHCDLRFSEKKTLTEHVRTHTGERPFKCEVCGKTYKRKSELNYHKMLHTGEKKITCGECGKGFRRMAELRHHNVSKHGAERPFMCNLCGKKFVSKTQINEHTNRHFGVRNHECPKCFKTFYSRSKLKRHWKSKSDCSNSPDYVNGKFVCRWCLEEFMAYQELKVHIKMQHARGKYPCRVCGKEFVKGSKLTLHMKIHTQTRDFICNMCGAGFIQKHHLTQHLRTHSGEKPYQCLVCFRSFAQSGTLHSHMKHHPQAQRMSYKSPSPVSATREQEAAEILDYSMENADPFEKLEREMCNQAVEPILA